MEDYPLFIGIWKDLRADSHAAVNLPTGRSRDAVQDGTQGARHQDDWYIPSGQGHGIKKSCSLAPAFPGPRRKHIQNLGDIIRTDAGNENKLYNEDEIHYNLPNITATGAVGSRARRRTQSTYTLPLTPSQRHVSIPALLERYIDVFSPDVDGSVGRSRTLRSAAGVRMFSSLLSEAFQVVSIFFFAQSTMDQRLEKRAHRMYVALLRKLQDSLYDPERSKSQGVLLTVTVLMSLEVGSPPPIVLFLEQD